MLVEQSAYANRWLRVSPSAKAAFAAAAFVAAFVAAPHAAALVALVLVAITVLGAGVPAARYLRVALPALFFLGTSCLSLLFSLDIDSAGGGLAVAWAPDAAGRIAVVGSRALAALAALLFLVLTTPLLDLIALLRRLRLPEVLLEIMVLCYRMLFVFSEAMHDTWTAQAARLGYATPRVALRSLGSLAAGLALQIGQRAHDLHVAALSRNNDGPLRFVAPVFPNASRELAIAAAAGFVLVILAVVLS